MLVKYATKIEKEAVETLRTISLSTHIPQSKLLTQAIKFLKEEYTYDVVTPKFAKIVEETISEGRKVLKKLAK